MTMRGQQKYRITGEQKPHMITKAKYMGIETTYQHRITGIQQHHMITQA